jgi:hypothetical protein
MFGARPKVVTVTSKGGRTRTLTAKGSSPSTTTAKGN